MAKELQDRAWACLPHELRKEVKYEYKQVAAKARKDEYDLGFMHAYEGMFGVHNVTADTDGEEICKTLKTRKVNDKTITALTLGKHEKDAEDDRTLKVNRHLFCRLCADADDYINEHLEEEDGDYAYYQDRSDALHELYRGECKDAEGEEMLICDRDVVRMLYDRTDSVKVRQVLEGIFGSKCLPDAHEDNFASKDELNKDNFARFEPKPAEPKNKDCDNHLADVGKMMDRRLNIAAMAMQGILSNADRMKGYEHVATTPPCEELTVVVARNALRYADELLRQSREGDSK